VEFPGIVADLDELYRRRRIVCCPAIRGGGTRLMLVGVAAFDKPIVSTAIAAEGIVWTTAMRACSESRTRQSPEAGCELPADDALCGGLGRTAHARRSSATILSRYERRSPIC
jgi:hypothetical protein